MNESHKYKLIYFHIPKCAGVSVRKAIEIDKSSHPFPHKNVSTALAIDVRYTTNDDIYNSYHKFSIVRNPFERMVSLYSFRIPPLSINSNKTFIMSVYILYSSVLIFPKSSKKFVAKSK